jgi:hypothetical protein
MQTVLRERLTFRMSRADRAMLESASERTKEVPSEFARRVLAAESVAVLTKKGSE